MDKIDSNSNITLLSNNKNFKFIMVPVWVNWGKLTDGQIIKKQFAAIGLKNLAAGTHIIHPLTDFIIQNWQSRKYNTQKKHALNVVKFMNYILKNRQELHIKDLADLKLSDGSTYLNSLTSTGQIRDTVKDSERTLTYFYLWLIDKNVINNISKKQFRKKETLQGFSYYVSPFQVIYPESSSNNVEHSFPIKYIPLLLEIAIIEVKPIALGLYFQLFGGLRVGEVVNLKRTQVKKRIVNGDFLFELKDQHFRSDIKDGSGGSYVKRKRHQRIFQIKDWGEILFNDHIQLYNPTDGTNALFVNRDGKAMSGRSYRQYFDKLKRCFLEYLKLYGDSEDKLVAHHLSIMSWSTHIGRGTFTNMLAEEAENPYDIAFPRGDKSLLSSLTYMSRTERLRKKLEQKFNNMHEVYIPRLIETRSANEEN